MLDLNVWQDFKQIENCHGNVKSSFSQIASMAAAGVTGSSTVFFFFCSKHH